MSPQDRWTVAGARPLLLLVALALVAGAAGPVEAQGRRKGRRPGQMIGRSPWLQSVHVETDAAAGTMLDVTLVSAGPNSLAGAVRQAKAA